MKVSKYQPTLSLKPTQFSIGMREIEHKVRQLRKLGPKKLRKLVRKTRVPVVVSPWKELYMTDRHHFVFACWLAGVRKVRVHVAKDRSRSRMSYRAFWRQMTRERLAYTYDQFGDGPRSPLYLPNDIRGLADDPYRSLAWLVRKEGGYENTGEQFAEYKWANLFRRRRLLESKGRRGLGSALKPGLAVARSPAARKLPGYTGNGKPRSGIATTHNRSSFSEAQKHQPIGARVTAK